MHDPQNVGGTDRVARTVAGVVLVLLAIRAIRGGRRWRGLLLGLAGTLLLKSAGTCYCEVNEAVGVDTTAGG